MPHSPSLSPSVSPSPPSPSIPETTDNPETIPIKLHLRKGQPLIRCRATKDLPDPTGWDHNLENDTFDMFCAQIRSRLTGVEGLEWPSDANPYIQPAHTTPQKRYKELTPENLQTRLFKAWKIESKRADNESEAYVHIFVYLEPSGSNSGRVIDRSGTRIRNGEAEASSAEASDSRVKSKQVPIQTSGQKRRAEPPIVQEEYRTIRIKVEGAVVPVQVELKF
ncbi:hypothetical protein BGZ49_005960 [Haplosporangium sp. Z 27]|nr:hypothetical protein BGZ49_005960 [Haplosporangium sp. Z 27]